MGSIIKKAEGYKTIPRKNYGREKLSALLLVSISTPSFLTFVRCDLLSFSLFSAGH
jgi:hypothetical protein